MPAIQTRVHIRWMIRNDMPQVLDIEQGNFGDPWSEEEFSKVLRQRNVISLVAEHEDRVIGYTVYALFPQRLELLNFAVAAEFRRQSVGSQMIEKLKCKLSAQRRNRIKLSVHESNLAAQLFLRGQGFRCVKTIPSDDADAYVMEFRTQECEGKR